ncbi:NADH dehydrogenase [ubiquinone] 1 alpha subcomplex subunit 2 [Phlebotomus papatasi]|uniref:NADH dehydrogenase [ubiquinone] 1 alpha subcomplex subunit 2 n=1 Tax=Phlebotomus papatasi TaxID=29031 RepID=A0A1B0EXQ2_PHLPP|nr:NADH dehydrogenase [ubiquinone] 1 alpha subcomplex subunit 2 [Phlebotomus papatasi]
MRTTLIRTVKMGPSVKELRLHLCQTGAESKGAREFVQNHYTKLKQENPKLPILIRECSGVQPRLWARYDLGQEASVALTNLKADDVLKQVEAIGRK